MIQKLTPPELVLLRKDKDIIRWRSSNRNGTLISNPTLSQLLDRKRYQKVCNNYVNKMMKLIIQKEISIDEDLDLKPAEFYHKRYDLTAVEFKIIRGEILSKL